MELRFDSVVVGGGPAGSVCALQLAQCGYRVCIVERKRFPRRHVGESLPPSVLPLLASLGLRMRVEEAGFLRCPPASIKWAGAPSQQSAAVEQQPGFQVDRGHFDHLLLNAAVDAGVQLMQPATVSRPVHRSQHDWRLPVNTGGRRLHLQTRFVVDASGRAGYLRSGSRVRHGAETFAMFAWWRETGASEFETRVEAGDDCWYWGAPLPDQTFNATVFVDRCRIHRLRRPDIERLYHQLVAQSELLRECTSNGIAGHIAVCDATCRSVQPAASLDWCKAGEAAFAFDPLSSQGVQSAMTSAIRAAAVVNTLLRDPTAVELATDFYADRQHETIARHVELCELFYSRQWQLTPSEFWKRRCGGRAIDESSPATSDEPSLPVKPQDIVRLAPHVRFCKTAVLRERQIKAANGVQYAPVTEPLVFLGDIEVAPLLKRLQLPAQARSVVQQWSPLPHDTGVAVLQRLWRMKIIEPVTTAQKVAN